MAQSPEARLSGLSRDTPPWRRYFLFVLKSRRPVMQGIVGERSEIPPSREELVRLSRR